MTPPPSRLTPAESALLAEHNARMSEQHHGVPITLPAPEFAPGAQRITWVGSPGPPYRPGPELLGRMELLQRRHDYWQRADLEAQGKVIELTAPDGEPGGLLLIPWALLREHR